MKGPLQRLREEGDEGSGAGADGPGRPAGHRRVGSGSVAAFLPEPEPRSAPADADSAPGKATADELELLTLKAHDECPICLEPYSAENPAIVTACNHRFHLSCLYEWVERSDTCAMCLSPIVSPLLTGRDPGAGCPPAAGSRP